MTELAREQLRKARLEKLNQPKGAEQAPTVEITITKPKEKQKSVDIVDLTDEDKINMGCQE